MEIKNSDMYGADANHYYCYNGEQRLLDCVLIGNGNNLEVLERL
jgi:hypothetical protein